MASTSTVTVGDGKDAPTKYRDVGINSSGADARVTISGGVRRVWLIERLWALADQLPEFEMELAEIPGLDEVQWFFPGELPSVRNFADHCHRILTVDMSYPVLLSEENDVLDGMHRVARAMIQGHSTIMVKRFSPNPEPDIEGPWPTKDAVDELKLGL